MQRGHPTDNYNQFQTCPHLLVSCTMTHGSCRLEETPMTRPGVWTWLALLGFSATVVLARPGVVKTRDGQTYDGEVDDKAPDALVVTVKGIKTRIERTRVASVQYPTGTPAQNFADRLARLGPRD